MALAVVKRKKTPQKVLVTPKPPTVAQAIMREHRDAEACLEAGVASYMDRAIEAGRLLAAVKETRSGDWLFWLTKELPDLPPRTAQRYLGYWQHRNYLKKMRHGAAHLSQNLADRLLADARAAEKPQVSGKRLTALPPGVEEDSSAGVPAGTEPARTPVVPGRTYSTAELALTAAQLDHALDGKFGHLVDVDPDRGGRIGPPLYLGGAGKSYAVIGANHNRVRVRYTLRPITRGTMGPTWAEVRRNHGKTLAPEETPIDGMAVRDPDGNGWLLGEKREEFYVELPAEEYRAAKALPAPGAGNGHTGEAPVPRDPHRWAEVYSDQQIAAQFLGRVPPERVVGVLFEVFAGLTAEEFELVAKRVVEMQRTFSDAARGGRSPAKARK